MGFKEDAMKEVNRQLAQRVKDETAKANRPSVGPKTTPVGPKVTPISEAIRGKRNE